MKPQNGRFDEDTYARAAAWRAKQAAQSATPAPATAKPAPATAKPAAKRAPNPDATVMSDEVRKRTRAKLAAEELDAYERQQKDKRFEESVRANLKTSERDDMNKYRDRALAAATAAAALIPGGGAVARGAGPAKQALTPAAKSTVRPTRPTAPVGRKQGTSDAVRRSEEGFSPAEANKRLSRGAAKPKAKRPVKDTPSYDDGGSGAFAKGGAVKRGWGKARCK